MMNSMVTSPMTAATVSAVNRIELVPSHPVTMWCSGSGAGVVEVTVVVVLWCG